jgi:hypothetical protein
VQPHSTIQIEAHADTNPIRPTEPPSAQEHGSVAKDQLLVRLFDELFPRQVSIGSRAMLVPSHWL